MIQDQVVLCFGRRTSLGHVDGLCEGGEGGEELLDVHVHDLVLVVDPVQKLDLAQRPIPLGPLLGLVDHLEYVLGRGICAQQRPTNDER
jgi:hypothetical protein